MARRAWARTCATVSWLLPSTTAVALRHGLPGDGRAPQLRQVGIAALDVARVHAGAGAQQLQRQVLGRVLEGGRRPRGRRGWLPQSSCSARVVLPMPGGAGKQVQAVVQAAQQAIELLDRLATVEGPA